MKTTVKMGLIFYVLFLLLGCPGPAEITPEEKQKRAKIQATLSEAQNLASQQKFDQAIRVLQDLAGKYSSEARIYKRIADVARQQYKEERSKNQFKGKAYLVALENGLKYYKNLDPKKQAKEVPRALVYLGGIFKDVFANIPIKKYQDGITSLSGLANLLEGKKSKEARYCLGLYELYSFRIQKAADLLNGSAMMSAGDSLKVIKKIQKATPESKVGKMLVFRKDVHRGDAAAFYYHEMQGYKLKDAGFGTDSSVRDLQDFWARTEVEYVLKLGVMALLGDKVFQPNVYLERIEAAILITNTLAINQGDSNFLDPYRAKAKPFSDPDKEFGTDEYDRTNVPYAVCALENGFFTLGTDKKFYPKLHVKGIELMEILHKLKQKIKNK